MEKLTYNQLTKLSAKEVRRIFEGFRETLLSNPDTAKYVVDKTIAWNEKAGALNNIQIRCNDLFVTNDMKAYNDYMITVENPSSLNKFTEPKVEVYIVTVDPKKRLLNIFNVIDQITLRHIGYHHGIQSRICLRQDRNGGDVYKWKAPYNYATWGKRYNRIFKYVKEVFGFFTIHTHDNGGYKNSSLGCTILKSLQTFKDFFRPCLQRVLASGTGDYIPTAIMDEQLFIGLLEVKPAIAVNGITVNNGLAKGGTPST